jgi:hypothetical protein
VRIREEQRDGRRAVEIRVGPALFTLDDLEKLLIELERRMERAAEVTVKGIGTWRGVDIDDLQGRRVTARTTWLSVASIEDRHPLAEITLGRWLAVVSVDQELPDARDIAVDLARIIERRRSFLPYLMSGPFFLYVTLPPLVLTGAFLVPALFFELPLFGIPDKFWVPVVVLLAMGNQIVDYWRRYGGGVWLIPRWRTRRPR